MLESLNNYTLLNLKGEACFKEEKQNFPIWTSFLASLVFSLSCLCRRTVALLGDLICWIYVNSTWVGCIICY
jgi:hypothetical protein